jgi:putative MATE family efflux protein
MVNLTDGNIKKNLIVFALPYLFSSFMQTFYGMVDLYVVGLYNATSSTSAVTIGSQVMHMLTVIILGLAMGSTVKIGTEIGRGDKSAVKKTIVNTFFLFTIIALVLTLLLLVFTKNIVALMLTPQEAVKEAVEYLRICFAGIPFIIFYNIISAIYRGMGDTKRPMYFVLVACIVNIVLDFLFIGYLKMGAAGAALGTVISQAVSVIISLIFIRKSENSIKLKKSDFVFDTNCCFKIFKIGLPISLQDGLIQISFLIITIIANSRGLEISAAVGIVEKIIGFLFLVPSAFLASVSAITAQNYGAGKKENARIALRFALLVTVSWGILCSIYCQFLPNTLISLFTKDELVVKFGCQYLMSYVLDTVFAAIHFCFCGFFCGIQKSFLSFIQNIISILFARIPGAYFASVMWKENLYPMGWAAPLGSILSALLCICFYIFIRHKEKNKF